ncbi:MAG TPA: protein kinase [Candidatus Eisenbacteria bacterium]|nr:protein kinase [Candidatus Eisenbacteria bacterium]
MDALIGKSFSHYRIERELGQGGMATVYLADDLKHHRKVGIKFVRPEVVAAIGRERFLREIEIAARLSHPHILPLFDSGAVHGKLYYVTPYIEGESLRARLGRDRQLPLEEALRLSREIASALGYAHSQGLVHRDIKPENVLLSEGIALVADFGVARATSQGALAEQEKTRTFGTTPGAIIGTPRYMSPEQAVGEDVDGRSDLYALACVLYEMLAGAPPFTERALDALLRQHLTVVPKLVTEHRPDLPPGIAHAIAKALAKDRTNRYETMARFAEALDAVAIGPAIPVNAPAAAGSSPPNNLPRQRTQFIGRERELAECAGLIGLARLLTLTGSGGCGKTRTALKLAESLLSEYSDGVWFVDLAPSQDASHVLRAAANVLEVREEPGAPLVGTLAHHLKEMRTLIVLDNCEHVLGAAAEFVDHLLSASRHLRLLVTSREALGIPGERTFPLRPLSVPTAGTDQDFSLVAASESVKLFTDRARLADGRFELTEKNASAVADICRRVDGIPLAIELAAARVKMLSVGQIQSKLNDRFRLLTGGSKTGLARHQTLQATIEWSYAHLSQEDQRVFRLLAVFAGGWTLDAAVAVAGDAVGDFETLDAITRLADKSLVVIDHGDTEPRYTMLETVRQYAEERLEEAMEGREARSRHLAFFLALAEEAEPSFHGPDQDLWCSRLDPEQPNILSAHRWCGRVEGRAEQGLNLVRAVSPYWHRRGLMPEAYRVTVEALSRPGADGRSVARRRALHAAGQFGYFLGRYREARGYLEESLSIARELGDRRGVVLALGTLAGVEAALGNGTDAWGHAKVALSQARELGNAQILSNALNSMAELNRDCGDLEGAEPLYEEALAIDRGVGDRANTAITLSNLAIVAIMRGAGDRARTRLLELLAISEESGLKRQGQAALDDCAGLAASVGEWECAARLFGAAEAEIEREGYHREPSDELFLTPLISRARDGLGGVSFGVAVAAGRALDFADAITQAKSWLVGATIPKEVT